VATFTALGNGCLVVAARRARWPPKNLGVLLADVSLAAGLNLWAARVVPPRSLFDDLRDAFWVYAGGTVALWTGTYGRPVGLALLTASILPLQLAMAARNGIAPGAVDWPKFVSRSLWMGAAFLVGDRVTPTASRGAAAVAAEADRRAAEIEGRRIAADLHDAVKNKLTRIALQARGAVSRADVDGAMRMLELIGSEAESALQEMRRLLKLIHADDTHPSPTGLASLGQLVERLRHAGLDVRLTVNGDIGRGT
jgi:signal transduction histidine kinase